MSQLSALPTPARVGPQAVRAPDTKAQTKQTPAFLQHLDAATQRHDDRTADAGRRSPSPDNAAGAERSQAPASASSTKVVGADSTPSAEGSDHAEGSTVTAAAMPGKTPSLTASPDAKPIDDAKNPLQGADKPDATSPALVNTMLALINQVTPVAAADSTPSGGDATGSGSTASASGSGADAGLPLLIVAGSVAVTAAASAVALPMKELSASVGAALGPMLAVNQTLDQKSLKGTDSLQQSLAMLTPGITASAAPLAVQALQLPSTGNAQAFQQQLGQQVAWLSGQEIKQASIRLHPKDLGQLDIKVSVDQGKVNVIFSAQHPAAVTAVQQTLPQLGHMLAQHGLALGHAEVGQQGSRSPSQQGRSHATAGNGSPINDSIEATAPGSPAMLVGVGLLDAFA